MVEFPQVPVEAVGVLEVPAGQEVLLIQTASFIDFLSTVTFSFRHVGCQNAPKVLKQIFF